MLIAAIIAFCIFRWDMKTSEGLQRKTFLGMQTFTYDYPLGYVVGSLQDLAILEEIFRGRKTRYQVLWVGLPDLLGKHFCQLMEDERTAKRFDVFLVYDMRGDFISRLNVEQAKFKALY